MGAATFVTRSRTADANAAFNECVERARYEYGNAGYTGSIAEKNSFKLATEDILPTKEAKQLANKILDDDNDNMFSDKYGPAGAIQLQEGGWLFFGWASE